MPKALQHEYPRWEGSYQDPTQDVFAWPGRIRFVSAQRARKLRKRGVPLLPMHRVRDNSGGEHRRGQFVPVLPNGRARYAWFEVDAAAESRNRSRALCCYLVATRPEPFGRKQWLNAWLEMYRGAFARYITTKKIKRRITARLDNIILGITGKLTAEQKTDLELYASFISETQASILQALGINAAPAPRS